MTQFLTIGRHLECATQTELVVELELALIETKQSRRFRHNSIRSYRAKNKQTQSKDP